MKRKVVLYIAMSLDGYIAKVDGSVSWLKGIEGKKEGDPKFSTFYDSVDTVLMGRKTYEQIIHELSPNRWVYEGKNALVVTRGKYEDTNEVRFLGEDYGEVIKDMRKQEGPDIWLIGGADLILSAHKEHLIDRYIITIVPTLIGKGIPLFKSRNQEQLLRPLGVEEFDGMVQITYEKRGEV